jgi:small subunit ribosomal protein S21
VKSDRRPESGRREDGKTERPEDRKSGRREDGKTGSPEVKCILPSTGNPGTGNRTATCNRAATCNQTHPATSLVILPQTSYLCPSKKNTREVYTMLIIDSKDCENIDKALKKYKKKFEKSKVLLQLRERQSFTKPSVRRRGAVLKAIYKQKIASGKIEG